MVPDTCALWRTCGDRSLGDAALDRPAVADRAVAALQLLVQLLHRLVALAADPSASAFMIRLSASGVISIPGARVRGGVTGSDTTFSMTSTAVSPANGTVPVSIS